MLSRAGLGDDAGLPNLLGEERLADGIVNLVRSCVREVLALEPDGRTTAHLGETVGLVEGGRPANEVTTILFELGKESWIVFDFLVLLLDLPEGLRQRLGDVLPTKPAETGPVAILRNLVSYLFIWLTSQYRGLVGHFAALLASRAQLSDNFLDGCNTFLGTITRGLDSLENGASYDDPVAYVGNTLDHGRIRDAESHGQRQVRLASDASDEVGQVTGQSGPRAGNTGG
mmetsp:Transcript_7998/g.18712  ORF Transcript_7998/g.18712 Transcript_7998/m.18712 type:complete len:229 (-) Transcript_7998:911-1597(-)